MHLAIEHISKQFSRSKALDDVSLSVSGGQVLALLGENGAGKSTLIKILSGIHKPDAGQILIDGQAVRFRTPAQAMDAGVVLVPQELRVVPQLTVAENILLGRLPVRTIAGVLPAIDRKAMRATVGKLLEQLGIELDPEVRAGLLDFASRQLIVIARALSRQARILVLDEPTASLERQEVERLFEVVRRLKSQGVAVIYISHRLEEIEQLADACLILRDGKVAASINAPPFPHDVLVQAMTGRELHAMNDSQRVPGDVKLKVSIGSRQVACHERQVVGLSGLLGSGAGAFLHRMFGSHEQSPKAMSAVRPREAINRGIGLVPGERASALILPMSIRDNIVLSHLDKFTTRLGRNEARIDEVVEALMTSFDIRPRDPYMPVGQLSGGNQQKVVFAKWLTGHLDLLLLDEPTTGIDIAAKALIHQYVDQFAQEGGGVFLSSTDLPELMTLSDEVIVMRQGEYVGQMNRHMDEQFSEQKLKVKLPDNVQVLDAPEGETISSLLAKGEIDGYIAPRPPFVSPETPNIGWLFKDPVDAAKDYYRRTRIFPIMHILGVRRELAERHPWLPGAIYKAFSDAKRRTIAHLSDTSATKITLPFAEERLQEARDLMGDDYWSYGVEANRHVLEHFFRHHYEQGLSPRCISPEEIFHPGTLESYSV